MLKAEEGEAIVIENGDMTIREAFDLFSSENEPNRAKRGGVNQKCKNVS